MTTTWTELSHQEQITALKATGDKELLEQYKPEDMSPEVFERLLRDARRMWGPDSLGTPTLVNKVPDKKQLVGSIRDLDRSEAILELVDNSIDVWRTRKQRYPKNTAPELQIFIDYNAVTRTLEYEDNAGGVPRELSYHLVIPGHSETGDLDQSIGSYRTGGKKAIFKLAKAARITTRFRSPVYGPEDSYEIHLDEDWLNSPDTYEFTTWDVTDVARLEPGQTRYTLFVRDTDPWDPELLGNIKEDVRRIYSLMLARNNNIHIYINDREHELTPLEDLYAFTDAHSDTYDLRPRRITFSVSVPYGGEEQSVLFEIVVGCRTTTGGAKGNDNFGFDFYGNDRLFLAYDQERVFEWYSIPAGAIRSIVRGYINIKGPNVLVPWDTHKRHINQDTETIRILSKNTLIQQYFEDWKKSIAAASRNYGSIEWGKARKWIKGSDVNVESSDEVNLSGRRQPKLRDSIQRPFVRLADSGRGELGPQLNLRFTAEEFRVLAARFKIRGSPDDNKVRREVADALKLWIESRLLRGRARGDE